MKWLKSVGGEVLTDRNGLVFTIRKVLNGLQQKAWQKTG